MENLIKKHFFRFFYCQEKALNNLFRKIPLDKKPSAAETLKRYKIHFLIVFTLVSLSFISDFLPKLLKKPPQKSASLDSFVPKGFVLMPIEIANGKDIIDIIGPRGVVDLYAYSQQTGLPEKQAGKAVKILSPREEEGRFMILIPEKEAARMFEYSDPFYAVIQNPNKIGSKIYKKEKKRSILVIEENF